VLQHAREADDPWSEGNVDEANGVTEEERTGDVRGIDKGRYGGLEG